MDAIQSMHSLILKRSRCNHLIHRYQFIAEIKFQDKHKTRISHPTYKKSSHLITQKTNYKICFENKTILNKEELAESNFPLLISYLAWLRQIKPYQKPIDIKHQYEQKINKFKLWCKHNLLFCFTVTKQFKVIKELFKCFLFKLRHLIALIRKNRYRARKKNKSFLTDKKNQIFSNTFNHLSHYFYNNDIKGSLGIMQALFFNRNLEYSSRMICRVNCLNSKPFTPLNNSSKITSANNVLLSQSKKHTFFSTCSQDNEIRYNKEQIIETADTLFCNKITFNS